ncbi:MAG: hypothetical protein ACRYHQ_22925 [Janthinobacterium lividum]
MDTHSTELPLPETEALRLILDRVLGGGDAVVAGGSGVPALLDAVADALARRRCRVLRASALAPGGLSLSGLMAQITERPDINGHDDEVLELGFQALTVADVDNEAVALLIEGGETLHRTALRYLQFTCRSAPVLRLVLAGQTGMPDLHVDEMAFLRTRLAASPVVTLAAELPEMPAALLDEPPLETGTPTAVPLPPSRPHLVPPSLASSGLAPSGLAPSGPAPSGPLPSPWPNLSGPPLPEPVQAPAPRLVLSGPSVPAADTGRRRSSMTWIGIGLAMVASIAVGVLIGRYGWPGGSAFSLQTASQPGTTPGLVSVPAQVAPHAAQGGAPGPSLSASSGSAAALGSDLSGRGSATMPAPPAVQPATGVTAGPAADKGGPDSNAPQNLGASQRPSVASTTEADPASPRSRREARQAEGRSRESNPSRRSSASPRSNSRSNPSSEARDRSLPPSGQEALYLTPVPEAPAAVPPEPAPERTGERRPIIGTYMTDQNGIRTFHSAP